MTSDSKIKIMFFGGMYVEEDKYVMDEDEDLSNDDFLDDYEDEDFAGEDEDSEEGS